MENLGFDGTVRSTYTFAEDGTCQTTVETTMDIENAIAGVEINPEDLNTLSTAAASSTFATEFLSSRPKSVKGRV